jgi:flavorubredoxin
MTLCDVEIADPTRLQQYSMYGHIGKLAEAEKAGLKKAGIEADIYQVAETLPQEVLTKVYLTLVLLQLKLTLSSDARPAQV